MKSSAAKIRAFIAISLPEKIRKKIYLLSENIPHECAKVKWVNPENIHLTLVFLGEISEDTLQKVKIKCEAATKRHSKFKIFIQNSGVFPDIKKPRILWVGVASELQKPLVSLASDIRRSVDFLSLKDRKGFTPHITFGRIKKIYNQSKLEKGIQSISIKTALFPVKEVTIFKSTLKPDGPIYTPLFVIPLKS
ncbi:MAG: 2'-5' RNA ligase [Candidatus Cloacimonas sp. 4484_209]|nr:MAG: 2'-5' RNA ligase [Candidatus Cloacimonas sp. 4484_209]